MTAQYSVAARNARADAITTAVGNAGLLRIYMGAPPADCAAAATGTLLSQHTMGSPLAPAASGGTSAFTPPANVNASATGTASHFRIYKADGTTCVAQGTVGASGADINLNTTSIVSGGPVVINSLGIVEGGA